MEERDYILWASLIKSISVESYYKLVDYYENMKTLYHCSREELTFCPLLKEEQIQEIFDSKAEQRFERHVELLNEKEIEYMTINDSFYPTILKDIYLPPPVLYYYGHLENVSFDASISIVGSRTASYYGLKMSEKIAFELASVGITVVSGMARGIDAMAHLGALKNNGKTVAILGCGVDVVYPKENKRLYDQIVESGLVLSEYPPGTPPMPYHFPRRNRIISGLSMGVVVVEAAKKSGSLITVKYALEQGREVYAIPGNINNKNSLGSNALIKDGAKLVTSSQDIIEDIYPMFSFKNEDGKSSPQEEVSLSSEERQVLNCIEMGFADGDKLCHQLGIPITRIQYLLTTLEVKGQIVVDKGKYHVK